MVKIERITGQCNYNVGLMPDTNELLTRESFKRGIKPRQLIARCVDWFYENELKHHKDLIVQKCKILVGEIERTTDYTLEFKIITKQSKYEQELAKKQLAKTAQPEQSQEQQQQPEQQQQDQQEESTWEDDPDKHKDNLDE